MCNFHMSIEQVFHLELLLTPDIGYTLANIQTHGYNKEVLGPVWLPYKKE